MKNGGAVGAPGLPEWGALPIPKKLLAKGVRDMVRISDARMSGTSFGTCILHVSPEAARGGPLALVRGRRPHRARHRPARRLDLLVEPDELARRRGAWTPPAPFFSRGYGRSVRRARHVGGSGLRLRFPACRRADAGTENLLRLRRPMHDVRCRRSSTSCASLDRDPRHGPVAARAHAHLHVWRRAPAGIAAAARRACLHDARGLGARGHARAGPRACRQN